jgi:subtilisin family serine protease
MTRVDQYLIHSLRVVEDEQVKEGFGLMRQEPLLPMLVRVSDPSEAGGLEAPDCRVTSRIGDVLACTGSARTIEALLANSKVLSIEASRPSSGNDCSVSVPFVHADRVHTDPQNPEKGDRALVAVIDGGIDVLHEAFQDNAGKTRIVGVWDQTDPTGPAPQLHGRTLYGTFHTASDIDKYIGNGKVAGNLGRDLLDGHGTPVASIAAGRATGRFFGGVAPEARILVVLSRIHVNPDDPLSIGYSKSHVDALSYIASESDRLQLPVVVNVSQGMNAGAHDGTSSLEAAFDNFSGGGRLPGRVIVKSAGNERGNAGHSKIGMSSNSKENLAWSSIKAHNGPDVVEAWFRACDELRFRLSDPNNEVSPWVEAGQSEDGAFRSGTKYAISYDKFHWDNGDSRVLVTISRGRQLSIGTGHWNLEIESKAIQSDGTIHAWLERDNSRPIGFTNHQWEEFTLSIPGTARTVIAVASVAAATPLRVSSYSSYGPTRDCREKPDLAAPGESIEAAQAGTSDNIALMSGTSMAAPHVSGAIALLFSSQEKRIRRRQPPSLKQLNAAQIRTALAQTSQNYNGRSTSSMGYGVVDVKRFLEIFA